MKREAAAGMSHTTHVSRDATGLLVHETTNRTLVETVTRVYSVPDRTGALEDVPADASTGDAAPVAAPRRLRLPCPQLKTINFSGCPNITDASLHAFNRSMTSITSLNLSGSSITDNGFRELLLHCRNLRRIDVSDTRVSDASFDQLLVMARLVPINPLKERRDVLASTGPVTRKGPSLLDMPAGSGGRKPLGTRRDPLDGKEHLCLQLRDVNFSGCIGVTSAGLQTFLKVSNRAVRRRRTPRARFVVPFACIP